MSQTLRRPMTMAEFLAWEEEQPAKYEFNGHGIVAMTGGTVAHPLICVNVTTSLAIRLRGRPCRAHGGELKIEVAGSIRYPDAFVVRTPQVLTASVAQHPVVVFEVLSPSTATVAFTEKHDGYRDTPSVQRYVILRQDRIHATVFTQDGQGWSRGVLTEDMTLAMEEIGIEIPMAEFYEGIVFDPT